MVFSRRSLLVSGALTFTTGVTGCLSEVGGMTKDSPQMERQSILHTDESPLSRTIAGERAPFNAAVFRGSPEDALNWDVLRERNPQIPERYRDVGENAVVTLFQTALKLVQPGESEGSEVSIEFEPDVTRFVLNLDTWPERTDADGEPRYYVNLARYKWSREDPPATETAIEVPGFGSFDHVE